MFLYSSRRNCYDNLKLRTRSGLEGKLTAFFSRNMKKNFLDIDRYYLIKFLRVCMYSSAANCLNFTNSKIRPTIAFSYYAYQ